MTLSIEDQLLIASAACGLAKHGTVACRLQLFMVANRDLGSRSHQSDFQRALETGVDAKGLWSNAGGKGSGEYSLTEVGRKRVVGLDVTGNTYSPRRCEDCRCTISGAVHGVSLRLVTVGRKTTVVVDGQPQGTAVDACKKLAARTGLALTTTGTSAVRVLQDLAIDHKLSIEFD